MIVRLIDAVMTALSLIALLPTTILFAQIAIATRRGRGAAAAPPAMLSTQHAPSLAVLMPAHNEAAGIAPSIHAVRAQLGAADRLLVVADNCSDDTAAVARAHGAEVVERQDLSRRGKGYALDVGVRWLAQNPPALVVIVDADCIVETGALQRLAQHCLTTAAPVQALYLMQAPPGASLGRRIAAFAWLIKNKLRPIGSAALGWPCQLMGTGMAFPWAVIASAPLATGHLVEDMQLGLDLARQGKPPSFCREALVTSMFPSDEAGAVAQRTRWEHGHLSVIANAAPNLLFDALRRGDLALLGMTLDLMVPPLAALGIVLVGLFVVDACWWAWMGSAAPLLACLVAIALMAGAVMRAWRCEGRALVSFGELIKLPLYVLAKVPIYLRVFTKKQVDWVRTKRDDRAG